MTANCYSPAQLTFFGEHLHMLCLYFNLLLRKISSVFTLHLQEHHICRASVAEFGVDLLHMQRETDLACMLVVE